MDKEIRQEKEQKMLDLVDLIKQEAKDDKIEVDKVTYYKDFEFKGSGVGDYNVYVARVQNLEEGSTTYGIYSESTNGLIATVSADGKLHFMPDYIEKLKSNYGEYFKELNLEDLDFELPEEVEERDISIEKEKIQEKEEERREGTTLESIEKSLEKDEKVEAYSEMDTNQQLTFDKITNKQELDPNVRVTQTETLADMIPEIREKGIEKIGIIYSNGNINSGGRFSFVGINKDGNIEKIQSLENIDGTTTGQKVTSINSYDGSVVEKEQVAGMVKINGRSGIGGEEYLSVEQGQYGIINVGYVRRQLSEEKGEAYISAPIETHNIRPTTREVRDFMDKHYNTRVDDELDKANPKLDEEGDKTRIENLDDTPNNDQLGFDEEILLENGETTTIRDEAEKAHVSPEEFLEKYENTDAENEEEAIKKVHEEIAEENQKGPWDFAEAGRRPR